MTAGAPALTALLDELDRLRAAATPGPWTAAVTGGTDAYTREGWREVVIDFNDPVENAGLMLGDHERCEADAVLIVAAVNALPVLIADLRAHRAALVNVRGLMQSARELSQRIVSALAATLGPLASETHECVFVEEQEPSGRLILPPCLICGTTAMDALEQLWSALRNVQGLMQAAREDTSDGRHPWLTVSALAAALGPLAEEGL